MAKAEVAAIEARCAKIAADMGYELVDAAVEKEPTGKYLRFYIDRPEGISLDDCEAYHKAVRQLADSVDYDFMEVSSPGIDRPLKKDRDFERALGTEVEIKLFKAVDGVKVITGTLAGLEDGDIVLDTPEGEKRVARKAAALVKPIVDMSGVEDVDLGDETEQ
jgi:ribosome maturation factor RimP